MPIVSTRLRVGLLVLLLGSPGLAPAQASAPEGPPYRRVLTGEDARRVAELEKRFDSLVGAGKFTEAEGLEREVAAVRARVQGEDHWQARDAGRRVRTLERLSALPAEDREAFAAAFRSLQEAGRAFDQHRAAGTEVQLKTALAVCRKALGEDDPTTALCYQTLGLEFTYRRRYAEAGPLFEKALAVCRKALGEDHPRTAGCYANVAANLNRRGRAAEAAPPFEKALAISRKVLGEEDPLTAACYSNLATSLHVRRRYAEAAPLFEEALAISRKVSGEDNAVTATCYYNLGANLAALRRYAEAQPMYDKALSIRRKVLGERNPETVQTYNNLWANLNTLALELTYRGRYTEAAPLFERALDVSRRAWGEDDLRTAQSCGNLAGNLQARGRLAEAGPLLERALAVARKVQGEDSAVTAACRSNLAGNLMARGWSAEAAPLFEKALEVSRKASGEESAATAACYNNLATLRQGSGRYAEAEQLFRKALDIERKTLGEDDAATGRGYCSLAFNLQAQQRYAEAEPLFKKGLAIQEKALTGDHPEKAQSYHGLALTLEGRGQYAEAGRLLERALAGYRRFLGDEHPETASCSRDLAENLLARGRETDAVREAEHAVQAFSAARLHVSLAGFDRTFFSGSRSPFPLLAALRARAGQPVEAWRALEGGLSRGLADDLAQRSDRPLTAEERGREEDLRARLDLLDRQILGLSAAPAAGPAAGEGKLLEERARLQQELEALEVSLAGKYGPAAGQVCELAAVQARLPADAALLAWLDRTGNAQAGDAGDHWACLVRAQGKPVWVRLPGSGPGGAWTGGDDDLPRQVGELCANPPGDATAAWRDVAGRLYRQRLGPLAKHLAAADGRRAVRHLIILPSRAMAGIPAEVLLAARPPGQPDCTVSYAPSGTLFAWLGQQRHRAEAAGSRPPARLLAVADPAFVPSRFAPLPGSRREAEAIARLFPHPEMLLGQDASEEHLDELQATGKLRDFRFLHFATHAEMVPSQPLQSFLALSDQHLPDPVGQVLHNKPVCTGRLTAGHILRTWNLDADLVTLSACQSGLGEYRRGEGYLGFAQALFLAGARSLILSEWSVDDTATALLMTRFYQNVLGGRPGLDKPMRKAEALREAENWLRHLSAEEVQERAAALPRGKVEARRGVPVAPRPFAHPHYWAGFILVGDPD